MNLQQVKNLMARHRSAKKGDNGYLLIVGGSQGLVGALALAGIAALRVGCDSVTIAAPEKVAWAVNARSSDLITKKLKGLVVSQKHSSEVLRMSETADAVVIGPGMGQKETTGKFLQKTIRHMRKPMVLDADAIKSIGMREAHNAIVTPNHKELNTLLEMSGKN